MYTTTVGWTGVCISLAFWGGMMITQKNARLAASTASPLTRQLYVSFGVGLACVLLLVHVKWAWTWWGALAGVMFVPNMMSAVLAVEKLGMGAAQGLWSGMVIIIAFLWGKFGTSVWNAPSCTIDKLGLALFGLALLVISIVSLAWFGAPTASSSPSSPPAEAELGLLKFDSDGEDDVARKPSRAMDIFTGVLACASVGVIGGSFMVPLELASDRDGVHGLEALPSMGLTLFVVTPALCLLECLFKGFPTRDMHADVAGPSFLLGVVWAVGNMGSTLATLSPLGQTTGYPVTQANLLIAGLIGVFVYKEVRELKRIVAFLCSGVVLIGGAVVLTSFGKCK